MVSVLQSAWSYALGIFQETEIPYENELARQIKNFICQFPVPDGGFDANMANQFCQELKRTFPYDIAGHSIRQIYGPTVPGQTEPVFLAKIVITSHADRPTWFEADWTRLERGNLGVAMFAPMPTFIEREEPAWFTKESG